MLSNLFRAKSRDSDNGNTSGGLTGSSTPPRVSGDTLEVQTAGQVSSSFKGDEGKRDIASKWLLHRRASEKKKDKPERAKTSLFGHASSDHTRGEVKGAVKVSGSPSRVVHILALRVYADVR